MVDNSYGYVIRVLSTVPPEKRDKDFNIPSVRLVC